MTAGAHFLQRRHSAEAMTRGRGRESLLGVEMGQDQRAVLREAAPRSTRPTDTPISIRADDDHVLPHALSILALASSIRLDDPRQERERVVYLEVAIMAGRDAARTLDRWLLQSLAEYRGSRSKWDLEATTAELRVKLDQFDAILRDTADRLIALIPGLIGGIPKVVSLSASGARRRRVLDEVAAVSGLVAAIAPMTASRGGGAESRPSSGSSGSGG
jgi:hypothetical protein